MPDTMDIRIDHELVSIELQLATIRLVCGEYIIEIGARFFVSAGNIAAQLEISPWEKTGDLRQVWSLIGKHCIRVVMTAERLSIHFDNNTTISVENEGSVPELVNIFETDSDRFVITRYPADCPDQKRT